jgi:CHAT domain-containing protein
MLLGPVAARLRGKRLLIVADGALQYLPFAALPLPRASGPPPRASDYVPLVAEHEIVSLPSSSVLAVLRREMAGRKPAPKSVVVLADPVFDPSDERVRAGKPVAADRAHSRRDGGQRGDTSPVSDSLTRSLEDVAGDGEPAPAVLPRLLFTRREAEAIAALASPGQSEIALDFAASRAAATDPRLSQYRYVHFATHVVLNTRHPELSGIVLSLVDPEGKEQNGFLLAHEVYNLSLPSELVVLSGCRTGLGKDVRGEGLVGLTRGFMYAGAPRVLVSLWKVDDRSTAELMARFYERVLAGGRLTPAAALRSAQLRMWRSGRWRAPYYWAAFTLQGEYR